MFLLGREKNTKQKDVAQQNFLVNFLHTLFDSLQNLLRLITKLCSDSSKKSYPFFMFLVVTFSSFDGVFKPILNKFAIASCVEAGTP